MLIKRDLGAPAEIGYVASSMQKEEGLLEMKGEIASLNQGSSLSRKKKGVKTRGRKTSFVAGEGA